jgi:hypothetical protein
MAAPKETSTEGPSLAVAVLSKVQPTTDLIPWSSLLKFLVTVVVILVAAAAYIHYFGDQTQLKYMLVFAIGGLLGVTEILGRYTDSPVSAMKSAGAVIYVLVNAAASCIALFLILKLAPDTVTNEISQVLLAGIGAMAFLRSAIFKVKVADEDVPIGPAIILDVLLKFADAQVDRGRAQDRAERIADVIQALPLAHAGVDLPRLCFALMQNLPLDIRQRLLDDITLIVTDTKRSEPVKVMEIGLVLWSRVGIGTLTGAVMLLRKQLLAIVKSGAEGPPPAAPTILPPPPPSGSSQDLVPEIERQLAQDRAAATSS